MPVCDNCQHHGGSVTDQSALQLELSQLAHQHSGRGRVVLHHVWLQLTMDQFASKMLSFPGGTTGNLRQSHDMLSLQEHNCRRALRFTFPRRSLQEALADLWLYTSLQYGARERNASNLCT